MAIKHILRHQHSSFDLTHLLIKSEKILPSRLQRDILYKLHSLIKGGMDHGKGMNLKT